MIVNYSRMRRTISIWLSLWYYIILYDIWTSDSDSDYDRLTISDYGNLDNDRSIKSKKDQNGSFINIMSNKSKLKNPQTIMVPGFFSADITTLKLGSKLEKD